MLRKRSRALAMNTLCEYLIDDHTRCNTLLLDVEENVAAGRWELASAGFAAFDTAFRRHMEMEESMVLPVIEKMAAEDARPIAMLRAEHGRFCTIMQRMRNAVLAGSRADFALHYESFCILMHTHNFKEEEILYPILKRMVSQKANRPGGVADRAATRPAD